MEWEVIPLNVGTFIDYEKSALTYSRNPGVKLPVPCSTWLIRKDQEVILVDTGPVIGSHTKSYHPHINIVQNKEQHPKYVLESMGINPNQIYKIILSHLHWDHCGSLESFPNAKLFVQKKEINFALDPLPTQRMTYELDIPGVLPAWIKAFDRLVVIDGDFILNDGITIVLLPGHTPGCQGVLVETKEGKVLVAGDTVPSMENWVGDSNLKHIANGIHVDLGEYYQTFNRIELFGAKVLPSHDPELFLKE